MKKFKFSIFDLQPKDKVVDIFDDCNLHRFVICFEIDELECDQEHGEILESVYNISSDITQYEDTENEFSVNKDDYSSKEEVIKYLESMGGIYEK